MQLFNSMPTQQTFTYFSQCMQLSDHIVVLYQWQAKYQ